MEILRKVKIGERLPKKEGVYNGINKKGKPCLFIYKKGEENTIKDKLEYWYEPIEINSKSEEILPLERRDKFGNNYGLTYVKLIFKALEAAELEIAKEYETRTAELSKSAKERYDEALKYCEEKYGMENTHIDTIIINSLKIAAGI